MAAWPLVCARPLVGERVSEWTATQQGAVGSGWHREVLGACAVRGPAWISKKHKGDPEPLRRASESPGVQAPRPVLAPEDKLLCPSPTPRPPPPGEPEKER